MEWVLQCCGSHFSVFEVKKEEPVSLTSATEPESKPALTTDTTLEPTHPVEPEPATMIFPESKPATMSQACIISSSTGGPRIQVPHLSPPSNFVLLYLSRLLPGRSSSIRRPSSSIGSVFSAGSVQSPESTVPAGALQLLSSALPAGSVQLCPVMCTWASEPVTPPRPVSPLDPS